MKTHLFLASALLVICAADLQAATITLFAGGGTKTTGPAAECKLSEPFAVDFDHGGNTYLCEMTSNRLFKIDSAGVLTHFAGTGEKGSAGDGGPATKAQFNGPHHLIVTKGRDVLVADTWNGKIRRIDSESGIVTTFAGTGARGYKGDGGLAKDAEFSGIYSLSFDAAQKNLYLADLENRRVRAIDMKSGKVRLVAGNGTKGIPQDGGDAKTSPLVDPRAVAVAKSGDVYVLERSGNALRVVDTKGKIRTVVSAGTLKSPKHLWVDRDESVLIADSDNDLIRRYSPKDDQLSIIAGTGKRGATLDPDPLKTQLRQPHGVNGDGQGRIYISDSMNGRVLRLQ